jgi:hypothetical protein
LPWIVPPVSKSCPAALNGELDQRVVIVLPDTDVLVMLFHLGPNAAESRLTKGLRGVRFTRDKRRCQRAVGAMAMIQLRPSRPPFGKRRELM